MTMSLDGFIAGPAHLRYRVQGSST